MKATKQRSHFSEALKWNSKWVVAVAFLVAGFAVVAPVADSYRAPSSPQSLSREQGWWVNAKDGWVLDPSGKWRCTPKRLRAGASRLRTICATSDGGKHWRLAFRAPSSTDESEDVSGIIRSVFRWDARNAVVSLWDAAVGWSQTWEFWTRDGGRNWWPTDVFHLGLESVCYGPLEDPQAPHCADPLGFFSASGHLFFVVSRNYDAGANDYMLDGWPRTAPMPPCPQARRGSSFVCPTTVDAGFDAVPG